jgi:hypothetical protein
MNRISFNRLPLLLVAVWIVWLFGFQTLGDRLTTQLDGQVISSRDLPPSRGPRYSTEYTLRRPDGHKESYFAGATDGSLLRSMPVGTYLRKQKWHLGYERNGELVDDFPLSFYLLTIGMALGALVWSVSVLRQRQVYSFDSAYRCPDTHN